MKLFERELKVVEGIFRKMICRIVTVNEVQFSFMPEKGTIDVACILNMLQEQYHAKI